MIYDKAHYFNLFSVDRPLLEKLVATGLGSGGDWCDLFFENTTYGQFSLRDGAVTSGGLHADYGVGIRVLSGEKTGYAYSETTRPEDMLAAARAAAAITRGVVPVATVTEKVVASRRLYSGEPNPAADRYPERNPWRGSDPSGMVAFLERLETAIRARDTRIVKVLASLSWQVTDVLMFNSLGELKYDTRPLASVTVTVIFEQNGRRERQTVSKSWRMGAEMLSNRLMAEITEEAVHGVDALFEAGRPKGGKMPVVMAAGPSGILLHEAMGHAFEADFNRKGQSVFSDKMGKRICGKGIHILDDATIPGCRGSLNYDDEGVPGQKTYMVEDGVLTSYLHDRISARCYGVAPTGNGRRESFRYAPIPRMRATYMEGGPYAPQEILASVKKGIYVEQFANGQVKIGEGDFTFFVKSGFLIENGRLTRPVKDINIIGNGPEALTDITMVGNDPVVDDGAWTCGKEQSAPVACGIPTVLVKSLTVGGE